MGRCEAQLLSWIRERRNALNAFECVVHCCAVCATFVIKNDLRFCGEPFAISNSGFSTLQELKLLYNGDGTFA